MLYQIWPYSLLVAAVNIPFNTHILWTILTKLVHGCKYAKFNCNQLITEKNLSSSYKNS